MSRGFVVAFLAVLVSMAIVSVAPPNPGPTDGVLGGGDAVMSTDKACYAPGEDVTITATGLAWVPAIGSFPVVFWGITNASGEAVFQPVNALAAIGELDGTLEGTWNQTYLLDTYEHGPDPRTGTPVPPGMYTIWFYEVLPEEWRPPGWVPKRRDDFPPATVLAVTVTSPATPIGASPTINALAPALYPGATAKEMMFSFRVIGPIGGA